MKNIISSLTKFYFKNLTLLKKKILQACKCVIQLYLAKKLQQSVSFYLNYIKFNNYALVMHFQKCQVS